MKPTNIEHIGIAVRSLEESIRLYEAILGLKCQKIEEVSDQKVRTAFFKIGTTKIELLESTDPEGPISRFIEKRGEGLHHIAFKVNSLKDKLSATKNAGIRLIDEEPRPGADGLNIAFLHPASASGVLIEFCENRENR
ncbi:MAG TPA: methylmalonyl-CoA epimerase [Bacteroidales bacterium]|nr:methylmalonyl-CoA epimerase [Bacteroidales bacterium]HNR42354.1 methylmalonyl-CoA epimerase [Bacteroidales bacterium]HPM17973.1 methylmalonyl-CoA epimerase [Bacteroidales bacterium]HQG76231.1 methylmalonyl-CoA epimerase [Bacteroidales bacterium]